MKYVLQILIILFSFFKGFFILVILTLFDSRVSTKIVFGILFAVYYYTVEGKDILYCTSHHHTPLFLCEQIRSAISERLSSLHLLYSLRRVSSSLHFAFHLNFQQTLFASFCIIFNQNISQTRKTTYTMIFFSFKRYIFSGDFTCLKHVFDHKWHNTFSEQEFF